MYPEFTENEQTQYGGVVVKNPPDPQESGGEGGGRGDLDGNTCKSMADSCQCMTKTTTIL